MVQEQIIARGIKDKKVLEAMLHVQREKFVPLDLSKKAYDDCPLSIGYGQTISQPYIVAFMTEAALLHKDAKVLEIGTGSGYQAAILAHICKEVYSIEVVEPLGNGAKQQLAALGYDNLCIKVGDGHHGWAEKAPFDAILVTAAPEKNISVLMEQLKEGGRLIIPIGKSSQELMRFTKGRGGVKEESLLPVRFVPMVKGNLS
jgi:protein-L-isoaspartate(D-aspartate) O-methyltransferase